MGFPLRALAICYLLGLAAVPVRAAEVHLRGHWLQVVDSEDSLVGVLSRAEEGEAVAAELYLQAYRDGVVVGEEVHHFALDETVRLFAIPLEDDVDCYRVVGVVGLDAAGRQVSARDDSPSDKGELCGRDKLPVLGLRPS